MHIIIALTLGICAGALVTVFLLRQKTMQWQQNLRQMEATLDAKQSLHSQELSHLKEEHAREMTLLQQSNDKLTEEKLNAAIAKAQVTENAIRNQLEQQRLASEEKLEQQKRSWEEKLEQQNRTLTSQNTLQTKALEEKLSLLQTSMKEQLAQKDTLLKQQQKNFEDSKTAIEKQHQQALACAKEEFKTISSELLEQSKKKLSADNNSQIENIIKPLREKLDTCNKAITEAKEAGIARNASLDEQIKQMINSTKTIGTQADNLATALKGDRKLQGNWGEMTLVQALQDSGLAEGSGYKTQLMLEDEHGEKVVSDETSKKLQPDAVVFFPDQKALVIDSKVSLNAYVDYCNADNDKAREAALNRHLESIQKHIDELAAKDYAKYLAETGNTSAGFVLMYVPTAGALQLALSKKPILWQDAYNKKVCLVANFMLFPILKLIVAAWQFDTQNRNQQEIVKSATSIVDLLHSLFDCVGEVDKSLKKTRDNFDDLAKRISGEKGRTSLLAKCKNLEELGIKPNRPKKLPAILGTSETDEETDKAKIAGINKPVQDGNWPVKQLQSA